jgi:hypothetical protein
MQGLLSVSIGIPHGHYKDCLWNGGCYKRYKSCQFWLDDEINMIYCPHIARGNREGTNNEGSSDEGL